MDMATEEIKELCESGDYDHDIIAYFNSVHAQISSIVTRVVSQNNNQEREPDQE